MCKSNQYIIVSYVLTLKILIEIINGITMYSWKTSSNFIFQQEPIPFTLFIFFEVLILIYLIKKSKG